MSEVEEEKIFRREEGVDDAAGFGMQVRSKKASKKPTSILVPPSPPPGVPELQVITRRSGDKMDRVSSTSTDGDSPVEGDQAHIAVSGPRLTRSRTPIRKGRRGSAEDRTPKGQKSRGNEQQQSHPNKYGRDSIMSDGVSGSEEEGTRADVEDTEDSYAPVHVEYKRATACFLTGTTALPAEVEAGIAALAKSVRCDTSKSSVAGVPLVSSGGISFATIDFQKSTKSPLGFALQTFSTPADPATADLTKLQNQLNDYLAVEAGLRSNGVGGSQLTRVKSVKFFLQFQIARVRTAKGERLSVAETVEHQLGKVTKNAIRASQAEIAQVNALSKQL
ncbi:hypothetical protein FRC17_002974 [Serendipita sp. 399]|nr:hypothetical protein FRC17_002974 [Serendipita sp. 399]